MIPHLLTLLVFVLVFPKGVTVSGDPCISKRPYNRKYCGGWTRQSNMHLERCRNGILAIKIAIMSYQPSLSYLEAKVAKNIRNWQ